MKKNNPILPPTYFLTLLLIEPLLHFIFPITKLIFYPWNLIGLFPVIFGIVLNLWADSVFKREKTTVKPFEKPVTLITKGPFLFSRHPMYLGFVLILLGLAILLGSTSPFLAPIVMFIVLEIKFIPYEEKNLEVTFGQKYINYKDKVRKWL